MPFLEAVLTSLIASAAVTLAVLAILWWGTYSPLEKRRNFKAFRGARRESPLAGSGTPGEMRAAIEPILDAWAAADEERLPDRMDRTFRRAAQASLKTLRAHGLGRRLLFAGVSANKGGKQNGFEKWNDGGREWREGSLTAAVLEQFVRLSDGTVVSENYLPNALLTVRQSRHIRAGELAAASRDKKGKMGVRGGEKREGRPSGRDCGEADFNRRLVLRRRRRRQ